MFENRHAFAPNVSLSGNAIEDARKNYNSLVAKNISLLVNPKRPQHLKYFEHIMTEPDARVKELEAFKQKGGKIIGMFCVQVPEELIYAAGAIPIRLECGFINAVSASEELMPSNVCPLCRSSVGFPFLKINPYFSMCDAIVIPTTCDAKKKMADVLSNIKHVFTLDLPHNRDSLDARDYWLAQVRLFKKKLERLTGKKISRGELEKAVKLLQRRTSTFRIFLEIKKQRQILVSGRDTLLVSQSAFYDDINRWIFYLDGLNNELFDKLTKHEEIIPENTPRLMISGSPIIWPSWKVLNIIEDSGAVVVIDDSCSGCQYFYNTVEVADWSMEAMLSAIADKYLLPTVCPVFSHSDDRIDRMLELVSQYKVHGVIYHLIRLCQCMDMEYSKMSNVAKQKSLPFLRIETEFGEEDVGQIKTRIEAFIEMINARREQ
jgi:benzoyl-CoA reductase/2-hydroxyglutaryl-CoA dehydratase subunit BcrC/BadD/HgdB